MSQVLLIVTALVKGQFRAWEAKVVLSSLDKTAHPKESAKIFFRLSTNLTLQPPSSLVDQTMVDARRHTQNPLAHRKVLLLLLGFWSIQCSIANSSQEINFGELYPRPRCRTTDAWILGGRGVDLVADEQEEDEGNGKISREKGVRIGFTANREKSHIELSDQANNIEDHADVASNNAEVSLVCKLAKGVALSFPGMTESNVSSAD